MQSVIFLTFGAMVLATSNLVQPALHSRSGINKRQIDICGIVEAGPNLCARACGPGYVNCVEWDMCFNPSKGQVCCSDGWHCDKGYYCTSDGGCCKDGLSLKQCYYGYSAGISIAANATSSVPFTFTGTTPHRVSTVPGGSVVGSSGAGMVAARTAGPEVLGAVVLGAGALLI